MPAVIYVRFVAPDAASVQAFVDEHERQDPGAAAVVSSVPDEREVITVTETTSRSLLERAEVAGDRAALSLYATRERYIYRALGKGRDTVFITCDTDAGDGLGTQVYVFLNGCQPNENADCQAEVALRQGAGQSLAAFVKEVIRSSFGV